MTLVNVDDAEFAHIAAQQLNRNSENSDGGRNCTATIGRRPGTMRYAYLLVSLVQRLAIRRTLGRRGFGLEAEGRRLLATRLYLFQTAREQENVK